MRRNACGPPASCAVGRCFADEQRQRALAWRTGDYIKDPKSKVPGTKTIFAGNKDEQKINALIVNLKQFDATGNRVGS